MDRVCMNEAAKSIDSKPGATALAGQRCTNRSVRFLYITGDSHDHFS
jgi:hypothetical protein